jgi:hypothetical protein
MTYLNDIIKIICFPVLHVVSEHLNNLCQFKLSSPAKLKQEKVLMPWVMRNFIDLNPLLELI